MDAAKILDEVKRTQTPRFDALPDRSGVLFTIPSPWPVQIEMSLPALESYIAAFGDARSKILPAVAENWKRGERVVYATKIPAPMLEMNMMTGDALIHVRDEWFGWLHYTFTREAAREFGQALIALADAPAPPIAGRA